ncbi:hypothetical protein MASR2M17_12630 [Aminivibrio sp.]
MGGPAMKVAILGSGAMGSLFGGMLAEGGCDVTLIDIRAYGQDKRLGALH